MKSNSNASRGGGDTGEKIAFLQSPSARQLSSPFLHKIFSSCRTLVFNLSTSGISRRQIVITF